MSWQSENYSEVYFSESCLFVFKYWDGLNNMDYRIYCAYASSNASN
jgi:hypothetical protein